MRLLLLIFVFALASPQGRAQHYLVAGPGIGTMKFDSADLDRFTSTYNEFNRGTLSSLLRGFGTGEGLRFEAGYRGLMRHSFAASLGFHANRATDIAFFRRGDARSLGLWIRSFYLDLEGGLKIEKTFVNGVVSFSFNRRLTMESEYFSPAGAEPNPLNGDFRNVSPTSIDVGIAFGVLKEPIVLVVKGLYPVSTGGSGKALTDETPAKVADGRSRFPDDFGLFFDGEPYQGVGSDVNGLKFALTASYVFKLGGRSR